MTTSAQSWPNAVYPLGAGFPVASGNAIEYVSVYSNPGPLQRMAAALRQVLGGK